ncbi:hypothetical protein HFO65_22255 [Rhizobium laguerreae]|uniref:hypothetical protein n=1 Tax=Rhizobium laguerreae TaxID=1076926 RepID=UPI001C91409A|nr:hypothetical protein [Rhizobium laguerreae]MBY3163343.1 hypothetical protein [Rhizobium laguerreae]
MTQPAAIVWRDFETDGVPSSGNHSPAKSEIRAWGGRLESTINAFLANGGLVFSSRAALFADLAHPANSSAWVIGDETVAYNGIYAKDGISGFGSWTRVADLPYSFIVATDVGSGTANAIQATTSIPVSESALIWLGVFASNTASPVTVSFNGGSPLTVKTNSGNNVTPGGILAGMTVMGIVSGSTFRLVSDQASAAIVAAAEDAADRAENAAALALNNFVSEDFVANGVDTDFALANDPGSPNNMIVVVDGLPMQTPDSFSLVYAGSVAKIRMPEVLPDGTKFNVRYGNVIAVGAPSDGAITTNKLANQAVTYAKLQNISATLRLLGRKTAGAGDAEELSAADLRDLFLPTGSVVDSVVATYALNANLATIIPIDDTSPQITEGTEVLSVSITPKSATNKLRIRWAGRGASSVAPLGIAWGIFRAGVASAISAGHVSVATADFEHPLFGDAEYVPGVTTAQTISVRVGPSAAANVRLNGTSTARLLGGAGTATLVVEEIKA